MKPKLQLALDMDNLEKALEVVDKCSQYVDIIEIGTVLVIEAGLSSVRKIRDKKPNSLLLADIRIIKAGGKLAKMTYESGANIITIMSDATEETFEAVIKEKKEKISREVLIEINDTYTEQDLKKWKRYDLTHLIFHRGSEIKDTNEEWNQEDFQEIIRLNEMGFKVYVTGGIGIQEISLFKNIPVECFIVGRTIANAERPEEIAIAFHDEIRKNFG